MKKSGLMFLFLASLGLFLQSCHKSKTYAEMLKEEKEAIQRFIDREGINKISLDQFHAQGDSTSVERNEYVLFPDNGVYMQIVNKGIGNKLEEGERVSILVRYVEVSLLTGDTLSMNPVWGYEEPEKMFCRKDNSYISGTFDTKKGGYMGTKYGVSVPAGWLIPLDYVNLGSTTSTRAEVKLIVPSKQGQSDASYNVYPCFYRLSYQR